MVEEIRACLQLILHKSCNVGKTMAFNILGMVSLSLSHKNGDDWGIVPNIVLPTSEPFLAQSVWTKLIGPIGFR